MLDNCEQVVDAAAKLAETLLRACPGLQVLATSREALGIGGESVLRLSPLAFPHQDDVGARAASTPMTLFAERAAAAVPGFEVTDDNATTVAGICSRLDGLPLAIELAAARLRAISPEQILERLADRYALVNARQSQRTASAADPGLERRLELRPLHPCRAAVVGRALGVRRKLRTRSSARCLRRRRNPEELLDQLSTLVDKSILIRTEHNGIVRYRLLETLRDYGRSQISETDRHRELQVRHADWYRQLAQDAAADWLSPRQVQWMQRLDRERRNLRAALEFSLTDSPQTALEIARHHPPVRNRPRTSSPRLAAGWNGRWPPHRPRRPRRPRTGSEPSTAPR